MCQAHLPGPHTSRRDFLRTTMSCGAYVALALAGASSLQRKAFAASTSGEVVATEKFARVEKVAEGAWAVISTPQGSQFTTLSNGGVIAGKDAVLAIEGFMNPAGATWLRGVSETVAGRAPTHVVLTHFHNDHIGGAGGYAAGGKEMPKLIVTETVRGRLKDLANQPGMIVLKDTEPTELDLGGRKVRFVPRKGHTPSDVSVELVDPKVTWCGDLLWNGMFPNYVDALPTELETNCRALLSVSDAIYVPGHGAVASSTDTANYLALLKDIEAAARKFHTAGTPAEEAYKAYTPPTSLGKWELLTPTISKAAFVAWEKELSRA